MTSCIFCSIIAGDAPSHRVYEDEHVVAFLDIFPSVVGHTLVVPRIHSDNIFGLAPHEAEAALLAVQKIAPSVMAAVGADGFNLGCNTGASASQSVLHTHFHILPRKEGDGKKMWGPLTEKSDFEAIAAKIRSEVV